MFEHSGCYNLWFPFHISEPLLENTERTRVYKMYANLK